MQKISPTLGTTYDLSNLLQPHSILTNKNNMGWIMSIAWKKQFKKQQTTNKCAAQLCLHNLKFFFLVNLTYQVVLFTL